MAWVGGGKLSTGTETGMGSILISYMSFPEVDRTTTFILGQNLLFTCNERGCYRHHKRKIGEDAECISMDLAV